MRIFVLRDLQRAHHFLGRSSSIAITDVNARNLHGIVRAARGCQLIVNASASVFNQIVMRAALRLRVHYVDLSSHLTKNPFKAEQLAFAKRFEEKNRLALINTGAAPGLTNLLVKRAAEMLDTVETVQIRLYESSESDDPISQWSPEGTFDEAISNPRVYRAGRFHMGKRFAELEKFRFPDPVGNANVVLAAQDEVATLPYFIPMQRMDVKIGGNEFDRLRRWYKQGKLSKSRGIVRQRFPQTLSPRKIANLIRQGILQNARFAAVVLTSGIKRRARQEQRLLIRTDCIFPTLYQIRQQGLYTTPVAYATAVSAGSFARRNAPRNHRRHPQAQRANQPPDKRAAQQRRRRRILISLPGQVRRSRMLRSHLKYQVKGRPHSSAEARESAARDRFAQPPNLLPQLSPALKNES